MTSCDVALPLIPYPASATPAADVPLLPESRIVTGAATENEADLLSRALAHRTGIAIPVVVGIDARPGDIAIFLGTDDAPEGYGLTTADGHARVTASTPEGAFRGAQTLMQLLTHDATGWAIRGAEISDAPRFAYRGMMLDVSRHFFPVSDVLAVIDRIALVKINVLHLHLTDDQAWRIEIPGYPELTERASASAANGDAGGFYTTADYDEIVAYAAARHITVVPEIDTPGHTHAVTLARPEFTRPTVLHDVLRAQAVELDQDLPVSGQPYTGWGVGFSSLRIGDDATDAFVSDVFAHLAAHTPGPWLHLGGDECWGTTPEDFATFIRTTANTITALGKTPIAWHEAGRVGDLPAETVGQYWDFLSPREGHAAPASDIVSAGGKLIMSPSDAAYLDMAYDEKFPIGLRWANGPTSVADSYAWDPAAVIDGVTDADILGIEAPLWTETVADLAAIDSLLFPRLPALAEIGWSPAHAPQRTWEALRARIAQQGDTWKAEGIRFHPSEEIAW